MLETVILGLLHEEPMHGYELRKQLTARIGPLWRVSYGSLYPTLKRLTKRGYIESTKVLDGARKRTEYRLTDDGRAEFERLAVESPDEDFDDDKFPLRLVFFRWLAPESRVVMLDRRVDALERKVARFEAAIAGKEGDSWTQSLLEHSLATANADLAWTKKLVARERAALKP